MGKRRQGTCVHIQIALFSATLSVAEKRRYKRAETILQSDNFRKKLLNNADLAGDPIEGEEILEGEIFILWILNHMMCFLDSDDEFSSDDDLSSSNLRPNFDQPELIDSGEEATSSVPTSSSDILSSDDDIPLSNLRKASMKKQQKTGNSDENLPRSKFRKAPMGKAEQISDSSDDDQPLINIRKGPSETQQSLNRLNKILSERFRQVKTIDDLGRFHIFKALTNF